MNMAYSFVDAAQWMLSPARTVSQAAKALFENPLNPLSYTSYGRSMAAGCEMFERVTRHYGKPAFDLPDTDIAGTTVPVKERTVWQKPFCRVIAFERQTDAVSTETATTIENQPKLLLVAPMSGHHATLLRGTVEAFLPHNRVFITDWTDARMVPASAGSFDLDDYIDYLIEIFHALGPDLNVVAVCQPSVPVVAALARMEADHDPLTPSTAVLMGGPIDTQRSPTAVNCAAHKHSLAWFRQNCIARVPAGYPGFWRNVYPGYLQLSGFMSMNMDRHVAAHAEMFFHLSQNDDESAEKQKEFYDEYMAVMDLTAEFFLQTMDRIFIQNQLAKGTFRHRDVPVDLAAIRHTPLMAVEGERDDITGIGQTRAILDLTPHLPSEKKLYHLQPHVGHYGVFNGTRFKRDIVPAISAFIARHERAHRQ